MRNFGSNVTELSVSIKQRSAKIGESSTVLFGAISDFASKNKV